jgi:hypothetical protein
VRPNPSYLGGSTQVYLHLVRGHDDFAESTDEIAPLTEEEKQARLAEMRAKLSEKKAAQAIKDKEDARANEVCFLAHHSNLYISLLTRNIENSPKGHQGKSGTKGGAPA